MLIRGFLVQIQVASPFYFAANLRSTKREFKMEG